MNPTSSESTVEKIDSLFQPLRVNKLLLENRMVMLPISNKLHTAGGEVTERLIDYYVERARGGVGLIIVQLALVTEEFSSSRLNLSSGNYVPGLNDLAEAIKEQGCPAALQIGHRGFLLLDGTPVNDLPEERIKKVVEAFGAAAERVKKAGFDAVEIHGGHGYLIPQFMSAASNQRSDRYGGSFENRMRFPAEVYQSVRQAVGPDFPVFFRLSGDEHTEDGLKIDQTREISSFLEKLGVDLLSISAGNRHAMEWVVQPMAQPRGCLAPSSAQIKEKVDIPVLVAGRINNPRTAARIIDDAQADLVGLGRGLIADPEFPKKAREGRSREIRQCVACNYCHGKRHVNELAVRCAINPAAGKERAARPIPAQRRKKCMIIGGGPAGLECAHTLSLRGHDVLLFDKAPRLGGKLWVAALPPHKDEIAELARFLEDRAARDRISVFLNQDVDENLVREVKPDAVVFASGAEPFTPPLAGLDDRPCLTAEQALLQGVDQKKLVIIGGGLVGCELAEKLALEGKNVTIVEKLENLGSDVEPLSRKMLFKRLAELGMAIHTGADIFRVEDEQVCFMDDQGAERFCSCEVVIMATGYQCHDELFRTVAAMVPECRSIGDHKRPRGIAEAVHEGAWAGRII